MDYYNFTFNGTFDFNTLLGDDKPSTFEIALKYFFYILSMVIAFFGNLCIIVVIVRTKSLRTKFNFFILNLAVSDMFMPAVCMWVHLVNSIEKYWTLGEALCKVHTFLQVIVVCTSVFTLTIVTLDRFLATVQPSLIWITQKYQSLVIFFIWASSFSIALPWLLYQLYAEIDWIGGHEVVCQSKFPSLEARRAYYISFFILVFTIPLFLMFVLIVVTVIKEDNSVPNTANGALTADMRKRALYMVLTVLIVLCVCWTPQQSLLLWDVYRDRQQTPNGVKDLHYISLYMAYTSSAINPVVYIMYNKCFRHAAYQMFKNRCKAENSSISVAPASIEIVPDTEVIQLDSVLSERTTSFQIEPSTSASQDCEGPSS